MGQSMQKEPTVSGTLKFKFKNVSKYGSSILNTLSSDTYVAIFETLAKITACKGLAKLSDVLICTVNVRFHAPIAAYHPIKRPD